MKNKIKQAGFKSQKECAEHLGLSRNTICTYIKNPPMWFIEYLELRTFKKVFDDYKRQIDEKMVERKLGLPGVEFEGPMGQFWIMEEVPMEALAKGAAEIIAELRRRGYRDDLILGMIKKYSQEVNTNV
jgi:hypothetical protein